MKKVGMYLIYIIKQYLNTVFLNEGEKVNIGFSAIIIKRNGLHPYNLKKLIATTEVEIPRR